MCVKFLNKYNSNDFYGYVGSMENADIIWIIFYIAIYDFIIKSKHLLFTKEFRYKQ